MQTAITVSEALGRLQAFYPFSVQRALDYLTEQLACFRVLTLYQHYFPQDYADSQAEMGELGYCPREAEFFRLVNEQLFPVNLWVLEDYYLQEGERYSYIPIEPLGFSLEEDEEIGELKLPLQVLALLIQGADSPGAWDDILPQISPQATYPFTDEPGTGYRVNWDTFEQLCRQAGGPIAGVPTVIDVLARNTGNFWLDLGYEDYYDLDWTTENMDGLAQAYGEAQPFIEQFNEVVEALLGQPDQLAQVITLWNRSLEQPKKKGG